MPDFLWLFLFRDKFFQLDHLKKWTVQISISTTLQVFHCRIKKKMNLALLFRFKKAENQYMSHKKYGVHLGLSGPFDLVCLQYSSSVRKTHSPSARASSPTTRTANSTLGLKWPTSHPRYTIYYFYVYFWGIQLFFT